MFEYDNDISTSGPIGTRAFHISNDFTNPIELPSKGYCRLVKAQQNGKWKVLKGLKPEYASNEQYRAMISKEYSLMSQLDHSNIVRVSEMKEVPEWGPCIVMEYVDGRTLKDFIRENPSVQQRRQVLSELLDAMAHFHKKQIVHQDLKPSNILITNDGNHVKIIDFGLSDSREYAILKEPGYTKAYASPEQLSGGGIDNRSDLYSFGLILQQLFPKQYTRIAKKCLQPQREKRYGTAEEIAVALSNRDLLRPRLFTYSSVIIGLILILLFIFYFVDYKIAKNNQQQTITKTIVQTNSKEKTKTIVQTGSKEETETFGSPREAPKQTEEANPAPAEDYVMQQVAVFSQKLDSIYAPYEQAYQAGKLLYRDIARSMKGTCSSDAICISLKMEYELFSTKTDQNLFDMECCKLLQKKNIRYADINKLPLTVTMKYEVSEEEYERIQAEKAYWDNEYKAAGERQREALKKYR